MSHRHSANCGCSEDAKQADSIQSSLYASVDRDRIWCLNERVPNSGKNVIKPWHERHTGERLQSEEDDGELLLYIPFTTAVHIKSLACMAWGDWQPKRLKLFANRDDIDLSNASELTAAQEIECNEDTEGYLDYPLKQVKFQHVSSLTIYVPESVSGGASGIHFIHLKGVSTENKRQVVNVVYEARANPADHKINEQHGVHHGIS